MSASFQQAMHDIIIEKSIRAIDLYSKFTKENQTFAIAGGVLQIKNSTLSKKDMRNKKDRFFSATFRIMHR